MARFEEAFDWLSKRLQGRVAVDLVYYRVSNGNITDTIPLSKKCYIGRTAFRIAKRDKSTLYFSDKDFFIPVVELKINDEIFLPVKGDFIEQILPGPEGTQRYEVIAPEDEPSWRYSEPERMTYRIHTKRMKLNVG